MYSLIATDYDGTLVKDGKTPTSQFWQKLNMLSMRGVTFVLSSGRPYNQLKKLFYPAFTSTVFISSDGAQAMYRNCLLYKLTVEKSGAKELCKAALAQNMTPIAALREENRHVTDEMLKLPVFLSGDIFKIIVVKNGIDASKLIAAAEERNMRVCFQDETYIEFCNKDANKGAALKKVAEKFSVKKEQIIVFGDGINDLPMFEIAEKSVAPESANETVKQKADEITDSIEKYIIELK